MALFEERVDSQVRTHAMWDLSPGRSVLQRRLAGLGPQPLDIGDHTLRGQPFHHSICETPCVAAARSARPGTADTLDADEALDVHASDLYAAFVSALEAAAPLGSVNG